MSQPAGSNKRKTNSQRKRVEPQYNTPPFIKDPLIEKPAEMEKPVPFITIKADNSFAVSPQACDLLQKIDGKIGVITVAGLYRTGKSYVLNRLAGCSKGFSIGSFVEPCTQGIHMWIVPRGHSAQYLNLDMAVILLDTEVIMFVNVTEVINQLRRLQNHDIKIFALGLLLSSSFIYNSMGSIDEGALDRLSTLVAELSNQIKMQTAGDIEDEHQLSRFFPKFVWLCRDFHLKLEVGGNPITATEYLENALKPLQGEPQRVESRNRIRGSIVNFFKDRSGFVLRRPVTDEKMLQTLETCPESELRPQFLENMNEFIQLMYSNLESKQLFGETVNGRMFAQLTRSYVTALNEGGVPVIRSAWDNVVETENQRALTLVFADFEKSWAKDVLDIEFALEEEELEKAFHLKERAAVKQFRMIVKGAASTSHEEILIEQLRVAYLSSKVKNAKKSNKECEDLLEKLCANIEKTVNDRGTAMTIEQLGIEWETAVREKYLPVAHGPAKHDVLTQTLRKRITATAARISKGSIKQIRDEAEKLNKKTAEEQKLEIKKIEKLYADVKANWMRSREEVGALAAENSKLLGLIEKFGDVVS